MKTIVFSNHKGGVAKTTCAFNTAVALAKKGYKVLGIDVDQQGNFSDSCGIDLEELEQTQKNSLRLMLDDNADFYNFRRETLIDEKVRPRFDVIPCSLDDDAETLIAGLSVSRELRLRKKLIPARQEYDFCIIDTPPSLGIVTVNALAVADITIIPIQPSRYALLGIKQLLRKISQVSADHAPNMAVMALLTRFIQKQTFDKIVRTQVIERFTEDLVFTTTIPKAVAIEEATATKQSIIESDSTSFATMAFRQFANELLETLGYEQETIQSGTVSKFAKRGD
ncbi:MAG: ParA family protein [Pyrinomonadaceae bacterium]